MQNNRIETLDVIRGLCLLGILQANLLLFQYGSFGTEMIELFAINSHDWISFYVVKVVVEGSFMPIFAFLFGYGMVLLHSKSVALDQRPKWLLARRFIM
ncbi:putative membrane protein YeiB [Alkalihalobacillus xiaoxiensis]|uniref:Membrane protein YeiB n=1 Tax=Shouchella xiaoxiensis TaxID=766895 RepID=A0ABS2SNJ3_9BACI|nr:hypothetical protein [Shouchella xiaoxiensis]MBM7837092.1 putative membrane protein YeiB [Shouchella xiaoxiensis]